MTPTIVRVMLSLALVPLTPWLYVEVFWLLDRHSRLAPVGGLAATDLIVGGFTLAACTVLWLGDPVWMKGRVWRASCVGILSASLAGLLMAYHGFRSEHELGLLLCGVLGVGIWCVGASALARRTSAAAARVLHALAFVPFVPLLHVQTTSELGQWRPGGVDGEFFCTTVFSGTALVVAWLAIWYRSVVWTPARSVKTLLALVLSVLAGGLVFGYHELGSDDLSFVLGGLCFAGAWFAGTALAWRPTAAERLHPVGGGPVETVYCPKCRHDLRGLHEARCPECGTEYTLDALVGSAYPPAAP